MNAKSKQAEPDAGVTLRWHDLSRDLRESLSGKLVGLWNAASDGEAFDALSEDKQQALLLFQKRFLAKDLWQLVRRIENVYGEGGVGLDFRAWPMIESTLSRRSDFTRRWAKRKGTEGGFYERTQRRAALHILYHEGPPRLWHAHFDLHNPVNSLASALRHVRTEYFGGLRPDWRTIKRALEA